MHACLRASLPYCVCARKTQHNPYDTNAVCANARADDEADLKRPADESHYPVPGLGCDPYGMCVAFAYAQTRIRCVRACVVLHAIDAMVAATTGGNT